MQAPATFFVAGATFEGAIMGEQTTASGRASIRVRTPHARFDVEATLEVEATEEWVAVRLGETDPPLVADAPDVLVHYCYLGRRAAREAAREARRSREVTPLPAKPRRRRPAVLTIPTGKALCWRCGNRAGDVEGCGVCGGDGLVDAASDPLNVDGPVGGII